MLVGRRSITFDVREKERVSMAVQRSRLMRLRRLGVTAAAFLAIAIYWVVAFPWALEPFGQARRIEEENHKREARARALENRLDVSTRMAEAIKTRMGREHVLREKGYVKKGEVLLRGPGIGQPPDR